MRGQASGRRNSGCRSLRSCKLQWGWASRGIDRAIACCWWNEKGAPIRKARPELVPVSGRNVG